MKKYVLLLVIIITALCNSLSAQDLIIKKNNEQLKVKVIEIGTKEIKFRLFDSPDGPIITLNKSDIKTIKIGGGKNDVVLNMDDNPMSVSNSAILDKTSSIKFNFFSPLSRHLAFSYEWMQKPGFNWEVGLGVIGPGLSLKEIFYDSKPKGGFLRGGAKFLLGNSSDYELEGVKYAHPLKGRYIKVEMILNTFSETQQVDTSRYFYSTTSNYIPVKNSYQSLCLNIQYGRQFIVGNTLTLGYYWGIGYGIENKTSSLVTSNYYDTYSVERYSHTYFGKDFPIVFTAGFTIGYIFKTPAWIKKNPYAQNNKMPSRKSMAE